MKKKVVFQSEGFRLEGVLFAPKTQNNLQGVVVTHPHPQFGGSMYNNVVDAVCEKLESSMAALKFNCRGVGRSEGHSSGGKEEGKDVEASIEFLKTNDIVNHTRIGFIGYSWGTYVGLPVTYKNPSIKVVVGISCPVGLWNYNYLRECNKPKLMIVGSHDSFAPLDKTQSLFEQLPDPKELFFVDTDHFYMGQEITMANKVSEFLERYL